MKFAKRKISALLAIVLLLTYVNVAFSESEEISEYAEKSIEFVSSFNIIMCDEDDNFSPEENVTRGELAQIICSMLNLSDSNGADWYNEVFKESNAMVDLDNVSDTSELFVDLKSSHEYYSYIKTVYENGIMHGNDKNEFLPDTFVTYNQFYKVMVGLLGYDMNAEVGGGYPAGYNNMAETLKITKHITSSGNAYITRKDMAVIIFNALDVNVMNISKMSEGNVYYSNDKNKTFLNKMGMKKITGTVTANDITGFYGKSNLRSNTVAIDNEILELNEYTKTLNDLLGRNVDVYVTYDDSMAYPVALLYFLTGKDEVVTIESDDFISYSDNKVKYYEGKKEKTAKITAGTSMIKNGTAINSYGDADFRSENSKITLVSTNKSDNFNLIIVDSFESVFISQWNREDRLIYNKLSTNPEERIDLKEYDDEFIKIYKNGEEVTESDITLNTVMDVSRGKDLIRIYISDNTVKNFKITSIYTDDGKTYYSNGTDTYAVLDSYLNYPSKKNVKVGNEETVYLNKFNQIVWIDDANNSGLFVAWLISSRTDDTDELVNIKLYDYSGAAIKTLKLKDTVKIDTQDNQNLKLLNIEAHNQYLKNYDGIIRYSLNSEGDISYIELPINIPGERGVAGRLYDLFAIKGWETKQGGMVQDSGMNGMFFMKDTQTICMKIPGADMDENDESLYATGNIGSIFTAETQTTFEAYTTKPDSIMATVVVRRGGRSGTALKEFGCFAVVKEISEEYINDEPVKKFTLTTVPTTDMTTMKDVTVYSNDFAATNVNGDKCMYADCAVDCINSIDPDTNKIREYSLAVGDIIAYAVNEKNYFSTYPVVIYKADMYSPYATEFGKTGWLAGTVDKWGTGVKNGNPIAIEDGKTLDWARGSYIAGTYRFALGYPISYKDEVYKFTTENLSLGKGYSPDGCGGLYHIRDYLFYSRGCTITIKKNKVTVTPISENDLKTYEYYGKDCSQILNMMNYGKTKSVIIINKD